MLEKSLGETRCTSEVLAKDSFGGGKEPCCCLLHSPPLPPTETRQKQGSAYPGASAIPGAPEVSSFAGP